MLLRRDGATVDVSVSVSALRDAAGKIIGVAKVLHDVGARKDEERRQAEFRLRLEQEVRDRTAELTRVNGLLAEVLFAASEVSIIATDVDGLIQIFNRGAERMLGYTAEEMVGKNTRQSSTSPRRLLRAAPLCLPNMTRLSRDSASL